LKKYYVAIAMLALVTACGNDKPAGEKKDSTAAAAPANDLSSNPDYQKGLELIAGSDCLTCHKVSDKLTGPSYKDVAAKYENTDENVAMLAEKIIKGGTGNWGAIPMTPHAALSEADAKQMVKYILLLKK
jgi:cytochrome c